MMKIEMSERTNSLEIIVAIDDWKEMMSKVKEQKLEQMIELTNDQAQARITYLEDLCRRHHIAYKKAEDLARILGVEENQDDLEYMAGLYGESEKI